MISLVQPVREFISRQRPFGPFLIAEAESYIVAKFVIFQQQLDMFRAGRTIDEIRTAPT